MAVDVALARSLGAGEGALRIYEWSRPTLSFGRNQPARERFQAVSFEEMGMGVVRRPTGGREVLHDRELTYSLIAPVAAGLSPRQVYRTITDAIADALRWLGVPAEVTPAPAAAPAAAPAMAPGRGAASAGARTPALGSGACFAAPEAGEIEVDGQKLVGSAQVRIGRALLQHGSLPLEPSTARIPGFQAGGVTLSELLPTESRASLFERAATALEGAVSAALPGTWAQAALPREASEVAEALLPYYESPSWTWRR